MNGHQGRGPARDNSGEQVQSRLRVDGSHDSYGHCQWWTDAGFRLINAAYDELGQNITFTWVKK